MEHNYWSSSLAKLAFLMTDEMVFSDANQHRMLAMAWAAGFSYNREYPEEDAAQFLKLYIEQHPELRGLLD